MKNSFFIITMCLFWMSFIDLQVVRGQEVVFKVELSHDTLLLGNYAEIKFTIENVQGKFTAPGFAGLKIIAGPNQSSSYSFINGEVKQSSSYSYFIEPEAEGVYVIEPAKLKTADAELSTPEIQLIVKDNPQQIIQNPGGKQMKEMPGVRISPQPQKPTKKTYRL